MYMLCILYILWQTVSIILIETTCISLIETTCISHMYIYCGIIIVRRGPMFVVSLPQEFTSPQTYTQAFVYLIIH